MRKRIFSLTLAAVLLAVQPGMETFAAEGTENVIDIESEEDFLLMADRCKNENFSTGKTFRLKSDLDLSGYAGIFVPVMDGTFNGNGHQITGVVLEEEMSDYGLFRYVGENGTIQDLTVEAEVFGKGEQENIGILAGSSSGQILRCTSRGTVNGEAAVGGIAGKNEETGIISACANEAKIDGRNAAGGIAGYNEGIITGSGNSGNINTNQKVKKEVDGEGTLNISVPNAVAGIAKDERANQTGGVAGYSSGSISYCTNTGTVGHEHLGYETGGIVGRQAGGVSYCENTGTVYGRRDVGGISGYFEPYEASSYDRDYSQELSDQLDTLSDRVDELQSSAETLGDHLSDNADVLSDQLKALKNSVRSYLDHYEDMAEDSEDAVREQVDALKRTINGMQYDFGLEKMDAHRKQIGEDIRQIQEILTGLQSLADASGGDLKAQIQEIIDRYNGQIEEIQQALGNLKDYIENQPDRDTAVEGGDTEEEPEEEEPETAEEEAEEEPEEEPETDQPDSSTSARMAPMAFTTVTSTSASVSDQTLAQVEAAMRKLQELSADMEEQIKGILGALEGIPGEAAKLHSDFRSLGDGMDRISSALREELDDWSDDLGDMSDDLRGQGDGISDRLESTTDELDSDWDAVSDSLDRVKDQFENIRATISDGFDELKNRIEDRTVYVDISDLATEEPGEGKLISCKNSGEIHADSQGGGIAGSIRKEGSEDVVGWIFDTGTEDSKDDSDRTVTRHVMAAVFGCVNTAGVTVKNDYAGGVAGLAEYGIIASSENYGDVVSEDGSYAGGIAGKSDNTIRGCYVLCGVDSTAYAGGVAGEGENISGSYVCSYMDMEEPVKSSGSIAGDADGTVEENYFVDNGYGAVDGVTRRSEATAVDYASLLELKDLPENFTEFTVRFMDGETVVWQDTFSYGEEFPEEAYPELPDAGDGYVYWESKEVSPVRRNVTVHAVRRAFLPSLASDTETEKPEILLGGEFYPDSAFSVRAASDGEREEVEQYFAEKNLASRYRIIHVYAYEITQAEPLRGQVSLRVLDDGYMADSLMVLSGEAEKVGEPKKAEKEGSYLSAETVAGERGYIVVLDRIDRWMVIAGTVGGIFLLTLLAAVAWKRRKKNI